MKELTPTAIEILESRYLLKNEKGEIIETPDQMFRRVAKAVAHGDASREDVYYNIMSNLEFLPNSPTLMNAGTDHPQMSACFVLPVPDDMSGIFQAVHDSAMIFKSGGGVGYDFSQLRPEGSIVHSTGGVASGPISFMKVFNQATEVIKQGGKRRGASMAILRCDHPDIEKFIVCKDKEGELANFNISVSITDDFMRAVSNDGSWLLIDPRTKQPVKTVKAKELYQQICEHAWKNGEPGVIFIDTINAHNPAPELGPIAATNPCVTGETMILTDRGYARIDSLVGTTVNVWNGQEWSAVSPRITGTDAPTLHISFSDGSELDCTPYHKFFVLAGKDKHVQSIEAKDLQVNMALEPFDFPVIEGKVAIDPKLAYTLGFYCGDGSEEVKRHRHSIWLYGKKKMLKDHLVHTHANECGGDRIYLAMPEGEVWLKDFVPTCKWDVSSRLQWLAGLMDSDGSVQNGAVTIWSVDKEFLQNTKMMLNTLGASGAITLGKEARTAMFPDGHGSTKEYACQASYRLIISKYNISKLLSIGLRCLRLQLHGGPVRRMGEIKVCSISENLYVASKVYCFTEPKRHSAIFGCVCAGNCGEQPLHPYFSCVLGSINLAEHVVYHWDDAKHYVDIPKIKRTVHAACWFLEDIIETSLFPLEEITRNAKQYRNIGLGIMGLADMLALMQIPYSSDAGVRMASEVMSVIQEEAKAWKEANNKPNRALTCIAPTGTISMIANVSAGCEPYFSLAYTKKGVLGGKELTQTSYALDKYLDISGSQSRKQQIISEVAANGGSAQAVDWIPKEIRHCFLTSLEIPYESHIQMQAALQEFTDAAVSKTINMPNNATVEDVHNAYMKAWLSGCKGITVYRSGSRQQEVISSSPTSPDDTSHFIHTEPSEPFTRPEVLAGSTSKTVTSFGSLWLVLNTLDGTPREVFCTVGKAGSDISAITEGYGRIISLALQHGVSIDEVCKQLEGIGGNGKSGFGKKKVLSLPDGIAKGIRKANEYTYYWHDKNSVASDAIPVSVSVYGTVGEDTKPGGNYDICPSCGATALINEAGCERCAECDYSRC